MDLVKNNTSLLILCSIGAGMIGAEAMNPAQPHRLVLMFICFGLVAVIGILFFVWFYPFQKR